MVTRWCFGAAGWLALALGVGCAVTPGEEGELAEGAAGAGLCAPGARQACYTGPAGTQGVGICHAGKQSCNERGTGFGPCEEQQTPEVERCDPALLDEDCDGQSNEGGLGCPPEALASGDAFTCALLATGAVKCWGANSQGQLGQGDSHARGDEPDEMGSHLAPVNLGIGARVRALAAGKEHVCGLLEDGSLRCWGANYDGQLGLGDTARRGASPGEMGAALPAVSLGAGAHATGLGLGGGHGCALLESGSLKCWGANYDGQLGLGDQVCRGGADGQMGDALPAVMPGAGEAVVAVAAGSDHTCALLAGGSVTCWGGNAAGQLGLGDVSARGDGAGEMGAALPAVALGGGEAATAIVAGLAHTCALLGEGRVKCWGWNGYGQLGLGDASPHGDEPGEMGDDLPFVDLGAGRVAVALTAGFNHTCALLSDGGVTCWGGNYYGQLGLGDAVSRGDGPGEMGESLPVLDLGPGALAVALAAGRYHTCALLSDGGVKCWGKNDSGELGLGDKETRGDGPGEMGEMLPRVPLL